MPESVRHLACAKAVDAQGLEDAPTDAKRRLESLALHHGHAQRAQADVVRDVARAGDDVQIGKVLADPRGQRETVANVVDRVDQEPRVCRPGGAQQVEPRCVAP